MGERTSVEELRTTPLTLLGPFLCCIVVVMCSFIDLSGIAADISVDDIESEEILADDFVCAESHSRPTCN